VAESEAGSGVSEPWIPEGYQRKLLKFGVGLSCAGFFADPGMGKTSTSYALYKLLEKMKQAEGCLVVAPRRPAVSVWPQEAEKWDDFKHLKVNVLHGSNKEKLLVEEHDVSVINPEGLPWLLGYMNEEVVQGPNGKPKLKRTWVPGAAERNGLWWDMLVIDESTRFKHTNTERFRILKPQLHKFRRRYILTGTPAPNGMMDLYGQIYILDMGGALGRTISEYRRRYFDRTGFGGFSWKLKEGAEEEIYKRLSKLVMRLDASDYLKLEPYLTNRVEVTLPEDARRVYSQMETLMIAQINDKVASAANAGTVSMKCRQIANGGVFVDSEELNEKREWENIHYEKIEAVQEIVDELSGKPALVAYEFKHDLQRLQEAFPDAPYLGGGVSTRRQREIEDSWNNGDLPVLLAQPQSVAHGLNLQGTGAAVVFHSIPWDLENHDQLIRRVWRKGQKERVMVHYVIAKGTVDELILKVLARKDRVQKDLFSALKELANHRRV
jgi:SNF2 family DNA or RNA helicase